MKLRRRWTHLEYALLCAGVQLKVLYTDGCDHVAFTSGVAGTVREDDLIVAVTTSQQTQVLKKKMAGFVI